MTGIECTAEKEARVADGWIESIKTSLTTQTATWLVGLAVALLGLFSSRITESVKFALNRADLRTGQYEELATEVSKYIFSAELNTEFIEHGWTTKQTMSDLLKEYNQTITTMREKEFVYIAWIHRFWGNPEADRFKAFMTSVRAFDSSIHTLNDEFEAVNITGSKEKIDERRAQEAIKGLKPAIEELRQNGEALLTSLD
jgi:hypothetical protein